MKTIRHIYCSKDDANEFASALFEKEVTIWSISSRLVLAKVDTSLDFGKNKLLYINKPIRILITGSNQESGICAYDPITGDIYWQRNDLRKVKSVKEITTFNNHMIISVQTDSMISYFLDLLTGNTIFILNEIKQLFPSYLYPTAIIVDKKRIKYYSFSDKAFIWDANRASFAILDSHISKEFVIVSEVEGTIRCFSHSGKEYWKWVCPKGNHVLCIMWDDKSKTFFGNMYSYDRDNLYRVIRIDCEGKAEITFEIKDNWECDFFENSSIMVSSNGRVIDVDKGEILWKYDYPLY